jgi:hypothetical protein
MHRVDAQIAGGPPGPGRRRSTPAWVWCSRNSSGARGNRVSCADCRCALSRSRTKTDVYHRRTRGTPGTGSSVSPGRSAYRGLRPPSPAARYPLPYRARNRCRRTCLTLTSPPSVYCPIRRIPWAQLRPVIFARISPHDSLSRFGNPVIMLLPQRLRHPFVKARPISGLELN